YSFNGTNSLVTVPDSPSLDLTTGMTLEAWVKTNANDGGWHNIMMKEQPGMLVYALYGESGTFGPGPGTAPYTAAASDDPAHRSRRIRRRRRSPGRRSRARS